MYRHPVQNDYGDECAGALVNTEEEGTALFSCSLHAQCNHVTTDLNSTLIGTKNTFSKTFLDSTSSIFIFKMHS